MLQNPADQAHGRLYMLSERFFASMLAIYEIGLRWVLRHRLITLASPSARFC